MERLTGPCWVGTVTGACTVDGVGAAGGPGWTGWRSQGGRSVGTVSVGGGGAGGAGVVGGVGRSRGNGGSNGGGGGGSAVRVGCRNGGTQSAGNVTWPPPGGVAVRQSPKRSAGDIWLRRSIRSAFICSNVRATISFGVSGLGVGSGMASRVGGGA